MQKYRVKCGSDYATQEEKSSKIDENALYTIIGASNYHKHCVVIKRIDGKEFDGKRTWTVPEYAIEEVK